MLKDEKIKDALIMLCYVCALGAFGAFFRWLQMQTARDVETGMMNPSVLNILLPLTIIAAALVLLQRTRKLTANELAFPTGMGEALRGLSIVYIICAWIIAALMVIGGVMTIMASTLDSLRSMYLLIAVLAILSGLSFPLICSASRSRYSPSLVSVLMTIPIIMYAIWLVASYRGSANDPNVWRYAIEVITICVVIIALLYVAGYAFGKPNPKAACYMSLLGAFMCITTLSDSRYMGLELIFLATAGMLLIYGWLIIKNRCPKSELTAEPDSVIDDEEPEAEAEPEEDTVIEPDQAAEPSPEPTIEAPAKKSKAAQDEELESIIRDFKAH